MPISSLLFLPNTSKDLHGIFQIFPFLTQNCAKKAANSKLDLFSAPGGAVLAKIFTLAWKRRSFSINGFEFPAFYKKKYLYMYNDRCLHLSAYILKYLTLCLQHNIYWRIFKISTFLDGSTTDLQFVTWPLLGSSLGGLHKVYHNSIHSTKKLSFLIQPETIASLRSISTIKEI